MREVRIWPCGCRTWKKGNIFYIKPCSQNCQVYRVAIEESKKRGKEIIEKAY